MGFLLVLSRQHYNDLDVQCPFFRLVVTTVTFDEETHSTLTFEQVAEKDQKWKTCSRIVAVAEISPDGDIAKDQITLTCETENGVK